MILLEVDTQTIYQMQSITIAYWEWLIVGTLFLFMTIFVQRKKMMNIEKFPEYRYYVWGFYAKFFSSILFVIVFYYIYKGGDTYGYFSSAMALANLFYKNPEAYFYVMAHDYTPESMSNFDFFTGYPWTYLSEDARTFMVIKLISPLCIITYKSFLISNVILGYLTYRGSWKLFELFYKYYPQLSFQMALSTLFIPSALFYGSGILKDSFTFMSTCLFTYHFHAVFISKKYQFKNVFWLLLNAYVVIAIKPYILMVLLPGLLFWAAHLRISKIHNQSIRMIIFPLMILLVLAASIGFFATLGDSIGKFSVDQALSTASVTQNDLKQDYYEGESFDIGNFDGTATSALLLFPNAVFAGMFRPTLLEADSALVLLSALENLILLYLLIRVFFRGSIFKIYKVITEDPILIFCITFCLFFAFMLGLTTSNFGALTRFKIPMLPFFAVGLFIINHNLKRIQYEKMMAQRMKRR